MLPASGSWGCPGVRVGALDEHFTEGCSLVCSLSVSCHRAAWLCPVEKIHGSSDPFWANLIFIKCGNNIEIAIKKIPVGRLTMLKQTNKKMTNATSLTPNVRF